MIKSILVKLIVTVAILDSVSAQFYNSRTTCIDNPLPLSLSMMQFVFTLTLFPVYTPQFHILSDTLQEIHHFGKKVDQPLNTSKCSQFITNSCCQYYYYDRFATTVLSTYNSLMGTVEHPYVYYFRSLLKSTAGTPCGVTLNRNAITSALNQHAIIMQQLKDYETEFIESSSCLLCMGLEDYNQFLYPSQEGQHYFMVNHEYYQSVLQQITDIMIAFDGINQQIDSIVLGLNKTQNCPIISNWLSSPLHNTSRVCQDIPTCSNFSARYFGSASMPSYLRYFEAFNRGSNPGIQDEIKVVNGSWGYQGNITYARYSSLKPPPVLE